MTIAGEILIFIEILSLMAFSLLALFYVINQSAISIIRIPSY